MDALRDINMRRRRRPELPIKLLGLHEAAKPLLLWISCASIRIWHLTKAQCTILHGRKLLFKLLSLSFEVPALITLALAPRPLRCWFILAHSLAGLLLRAFVDSRAVVNDIVTSGMKLLRRVQCPQRCCQLWVCC